ncbi:hypothetical protein MCHI_001301 [Candidatus Magnetoovum chiemensis]|nr:hypothetical protein MCHI_001301 [Candidatus Magnetoovum chiemensis]
MQKGITFINNKDTLKNAITDYYNYKMSLNSFSDVIDKIIC